MASILDRLRTTLADRYAIEREVGTGGMATVYLAEDLRHHRKVAIKVLREELAATVGPDRFLREIETVAQLTHPHILPLYESGEVDGLLYYVMPYIHGESLRARLQTEHELPIPTAVRLLHDIADALAAAHRRGVVHRDIKPENVLLGETHAYVTDFGVAKALSEATTTMELTTAGVALGTPAYMAPEQAAADPHVDHRADIYAFGVLAYEMVAGQPPFQGTTPRALLAARVAGDPAPVTELRPAVPPALGELITRCLAEKPADRWQTMDEILARLEAHATPATGTTKVGGPRPARWRRRAAIAGGIAVVAIAAAAILLISGHSDGAALDPNVVAVLPFRVAAADPALGYLQEGMVDLLAAKLTGEGAPRATDPRTVMSAWRRRAASDRGGLDEAGALELARDLGAGQLLLGGIVGTPGRMTFNASLLTVPDGTTRARVSVAGPADSLPALVDRLVSQLLRQGTALGRRRAGSLTTTSVEALKAYLEGERAYRRGSYDSALVHYDRAVDIDSTFTLAALGLIQTYGWTEFRVPNLNRAPRLAWAGRDRLDERDRRLVEAILGPRFPEAPFEADLLDARERAVSAAPDQADAWYLLGEEYIHRGPYLGHEDWIERAETAFQRAVALDSSFVGPLDHLVTLAAMRGDTAAARKFGRLYDQAVEETGSLADLVVRWDLARTLQDSAVSQRFWTAYDSAPPFVAIPLYALVSGDLTAADSMQVILARHASSQSERGSVWLFRLWEALNRGHPSEAAGAIDSLRQIWGDVLPLEAFSVIAPLVFREGDGARAAAGARRIAAVADAPLPDSGDDRVYHRAASCLNEQWRIQHGRFGTVAATAARLRRAAAPPDEPLMVQFSMTCAALLEAMEATARARPDAFRLVERVDSIMRRGPQQWAQASYENLLVARLFEALGEPERALAAARRGAYENLVRLVVSPFLLEEARMADLAGDREEAIRAYSRYLAIRPDPEPEALPAVQQAREALARLVEEGR